MNSSKNITLSDILKHIKTSNLNIKLFDTLSSTNTVLKEMALSGENEGTVIVALHQTNGRGRYNRKFYSDYGGIYLSILLKPDLPMSDLTLLTAASAVAVSDAIESVSQKQTEIKWVNDILIDGKKVCGILCEGGFIGNDGFVIVGVGINVNNPLNDEIKNIAATVFDTPCPETLSKLCAYVIDNIFKEYKNIKNLNFLNTYRQKSCVIGETVDILSQGVMIGKCKVLGIDDRCRLIIEHGNGQTKLLDSGEISIKK